MRLHVSFIILLARTHEVWSDMTWQLLRPLAAMTSTFMEAVGWAVVSHNRVNLRLNHRSKLAKWLRKHGAFLELEAVHLVRGRAV